MDVVIIVTKKVGSVSYIRTKSGSRIYLDQQGYIRKMFRGNRSLKEGGRDTHVSENYPCLWENEVKI